MMSRIFRIPLFVLLVLIPAACAQTTPSVSPVHKTNAPQVTPTPHIVSPLLGAYTTTVTHQDVVGHPELDTGWQKGNAGGMALPGTWTLTFRSDGIWVAQDDNEYGRQYIGTGMYIVTPNKVTLVTDSKCLEYYVPFYGPQAQSATYIWRLSGSKLVLQTTQDSCVPRKIVLSSHPWTRGQSG